MFADEEQFVKYIVENYPEVTDSRKDDDHFDILCTKCNLVRGFQVVRRVNTTHKTIYQQYDDDYTAPRTIYFHCPVCGSYKLWIVFEFTFPVTDEEGKTTNIQRMFRITSIPSEGIEDIGELPEKPEALRVAYRQAIRSMDANAHIAATAMFRRALQVITRQILGIKPRALAHELSQVVGMKYNGITITSDFSKVAYVVKEAGNQGAHPDKDPDLLGFTQQDAEDLRNIFMELVSELFIVPVAAQKAKENFLKRRKIQAK